MGWPSASQTGKRFRQRDKGIPRLRGKGRGDLVLTLSLWALWYHTLAGVRHLIWDAGHALDLDKAYKLGYAVIGGSFVLTLLTFLVI